MAAERVAGEHDLLEDDAVGVDREERAARDGRLAQQRVLGGGGRAVGKEGEERRGRAERGCVDGGDRLAAGLEEALEFVLVGAPRVLREDGSRAEGADCLLYTSDAADE